MKTNCPICNSDRYSIYYKELPSYQYASIVRCSDCHHIYSLITKEIDTSELYNDEVYKVVENRNSIFDKLLNWEYKKVVKRINHLHSQKGWLLDFGSGKGKFGWLAANRGWNVKCVETSKERADYARNIYKLDVNTSFYSSGQIFDMKFDILTLFHVLEHLPHPQKLLESLLKDNLKEDGMLVIEVPNIKSWQSSLSKEKWIHLDVPRHINHFTVKKLTEMMKASGFTQVKTSFFSFHLGVLGMLDSILKLFGFKKNIIFELKNKKKLKLLIQVALALPIALFLESIASWTGKGGIMRIYLKHK